MPPSGTTAAADAADPLLERGDQLRLLEDHLDDLSRSGNGRLVLLAGEAGIDKTALLRPSW